MLLLEGAQVSDDGGGVNPVEMGRSLCLSGLRPNRTVLN